MRRLYQKHLFLERLKGHKVPLENQSPAAASPEGFLERAKAIR